ncbi:MAG: hypothetical protein MI861_21540 [Pirellulales bacterium]|nr:hypothetical protein [Pirellulales bacterium]
MSATSIVVTCYFWFVRARKDRPNLQFYQLSDFRASSRRVQGVQGRKRLCVQQLDTGGVLIVNHSTRQNSVVLFECFLATEDELIQGDWGFSGDDKPPWNIGPETSIAFSPACFFEVPEDYEIPEDLVFYLRFVTASGKKFTHRFTKTAPRNREMGEPLQIAA